MLRWLLLPIAFGLALWFAVVARRLWIEARRVRAARAGFFDALRPLLTAPRLRVEPSGFPRLAGHFMGHAVDLQAVPDALTFRKLPALWLLATLTEPQPLAGETRIMLRPTGLEPFSTFATLPDETAPPAGFPANAVLRTTARAHLPPASVLDAVAPLFDDPAVKEVALGPTGLRIVRLAEEAPRSGYLLFRDADLGRTSATPAMVLPLLELLLALAATLAGSVAHAAAGRDG